MNGKTAAENRKVLFVDEFWHNQLMQIRIHIASMSCQISSNLGVVKMQFRNPGQSSSIFQKEHIMRLTICFLWTV